MRIVLFERCYKYLPLSRILEKKIFIEVIGTYPKTPKTRFEPCGPLGIRLIFSNFARTHFKCIN